MKTAKSQLLIYPSEILFTDLEAQKEYKQSFILRNLQNHVVKVRVNIPNSRFFFLKENTKGTEKFSKLAPGLEQQFDVIFKPEEHINYETNILIKTEQEEYFIPVRASCSKSKIDFPKILSFETTPVKESNTKAIFIRNNSNTTSTVHFSADEPFSVSPKIHLFQPNEGIQLLVSFTPEKNMNYSACIYGTFEDGNSVCCEVNGEGEELSIQLSEQQIKFSDTFVSKTSQKYFKIINKSEKNVKFSWNSFATIGDEQRDTIRLMNELGSLSNDRVTKRLKRELELSVSKPTKEIFTIIPANGTVLANSEFLVSVDFAPEKDENYERLFFCEISGRVHRLPIKFIARGRGPELAFSYTSFNIGEVLINTLHTYELVLENRGEVACKYEFIPSTSLFGSKFKFDPSFGTLDPYTTCSIQCHFSSDVIGNFSEWLRCRVPGKIDDLMLNIKGSVGGPSFEFDCNFIDFGTVSNGFLNSRQFTLKNTSEIAMNYSLRIPEDGYLLQKEFDIVPSNGCILPHSSKTIKIEFMSNSTKKYSYSLVLDVNEIGTSCYSIPIIAQSVVPDLMLQTSKVLFGECYINYVYEKFIEFANKSDLPVKYEIVFPSKEENKQLEFLQQNGIRGMVPSKTTHRVKIQLKTKKVGQILVPIHLKSIGSSKPAAEILLAASSLGPTVIAEPNEIEWGKIDVLKEESRSFTLSNSSPIPAEFSISFKNKNSGFSCAIEKGYLQPNETKDISISFLADDATKFSDELYISILDADVKVIRLSATGVGCTVVPESDITNLDFGTQFTELACTRKITLQNNGRKAQSIIWASSKVKKKDEELIQVFKIVPDRATIPPGGFEVFTIEAFSSISGNYEEPYQCKSSGKKQINLFSTNLICNFINPLLKISRNLLVCEYTYSSLRVPEQQIHNIAFKNVSNLPISFSTKVLPPFYIEQEQYNLQPTENLILPIKFNPSTTTTTFSQENSQKMVIVYKDHPQRDTIDLKAILNYPTVKLSSTKIDFGAIQEDTEKRISFTVENIGKMQVSYTWMFERSINGCKIDITPLVGKLAVGEVSYFEMSFFAVGSASINSTAFLQVEGGKEQKVEIKAESSQIAFKIEKELIGLKVIPFDQATVFENFIHNIGRVPFDFKVIIPFEIREQIIISPASGILRGGEKQKLVIKYLPGFCLEFSHVVFVKIAHLKPLEFFINGISVFPFIYFNNIDKLERARIVQQEPFLTKVYTNSTIQPKSAVPAIVESFIDTEVNLLNSSLESNNIKFKRKKVLDTSDTTNEPMSLDSTLLKPEIILPTKYRCDFGFIVKGMSKKKTFKATNYGISPISLSFDKKELTNCGITIEPTAIKKLPGVPECETASFDLSLSTKSLDIGVFDKIIKLSISDSVLVEIEILANIQIPEVEVSDSTLEFGNLLVGQTKYMIVSFENILDVPCEWIIEEPVPKGVREKDFIRFFIPKISKGTIQPKKTENIEIGFSPLEQKKYSTSLQVKFANSSKVKRIQCFGDGEDLSISIEPTKLFIGPALPFENTDIHFEICNNSSYAVEMFSLDHDQKYKEEEEILRNVPGYIDGYLLIPPRNAGDPLPEFLVRQYEQKLQGDKEQSIEIEKINHQSEKDTPPFIFVFGPPFSSKTFVSKVISEKYNIPILADPITLDQPIDDMHELAKSICTSLLSKYPSGVVVDGLHNLSSTAKLDVLFTYVVKHLYGKVDMILIITNSSTVAIKLKSASLMKDLIFNQVQAAAVPIITDDEFDCLSESEKEEYRQKLKKLKDIKLKLENIESEIYQLEQQRGNVVDIIAETENYSAQYKNYLSQVEEAKKKKPKKGEEQEIPPMLSLEDWCKQSDTDTEVDRNIKSFKLLFSGIEAAFCEHSIPKKVLEPEQPKKAKSAQPLPVEPVQESPPKLFHYNVDTAFDEVLEKITSVRAPPIGISKTEAVKTEPYIMQKIPFPNIRDVKQNDLVNRFKIVQEVDEGSTKIRKEHSRWVIAPNSKLPLFVRFSTPIVGTFEHELTFGLTGRTMKYSMHCKALCQYPEVSSFYKNIFNSKIKERKENDIVHKKYIISDKLFEFGPLLIRPYDGNKESFANYIENFHISNISESNITIKFILEKEEKDNAFIIENTTMELAKEETKDLVIFAQPKSVGIFKNTILCLVKDNPLPMKIDIACQGSKPVAEIEPKLFEFGKLLVSPKYNGKKLSIKNLSLIPISWKIDTKATHPSITFEPSKGDIKPTSSIELEVKFSPKEPYDVKTSFIIEYGDITGVLPTEKVSINATAESFDLKDVIVEQNLDFTTVKVSDICKKEILLSNGGKYNVAYVFEIPQKLEKLFSITPNEGILVAKDKKKTQCIIELKTMKEINLINNTDIKCKFLEPNTKEHFGSEPLKITAKAVFSKFTIAPKHGLNFGPLNVGQSREKEFEISNDGTFEFSFSFFNFNEKNSAAPIATDSKKPVPSTPAKKGAPAPASEYSFSAFKIIPASGAIPPGTKTKIKVLFKAEGAQVVRDVLGIEISGRNPNEFQDGIPLDIQGESCIPGIDCSNYESIFEEQQIIKSLSTNIPIKDTTFSIDDRVLLFGTVKAGEKIEEKIKIINPFKVPCNIDCNITVRDPADQISLTTFDIQPRKFSIPPNDFKYVTIYYNPTSLYSYNAILSILCTDGLDVKTKELKFELRGEGALPQITIEKPLVAGDGNYIINFPKTLIGKRNASPLAIRNDSILPATIQLSCSAVPNIIFDDTFKEFVLEGKQSQLIDVYFEPTEIKKLESTLSIQVQENHFEDTSIKITAEGIQDDIILENLDPGIEDEVRFGDCEIGLENKRDISIVNTCGYYVKYQFETASGVTFSPLFGHLAPNACQDVEVVFQTSEPKQLTQTPLKLSYFRIEYTTDSIVEWNERHKVVSWIEVEEDVVKERQGPKGKPEKYTEKVLVKKKVEQFDPEPENKSISDKKERILKISGNADFAQFQTDLKNYLNFKSTQMFESRTYTFTITNTGKVKLPIKWVSKNSSNFSITPEKYTLKPQEITSFQIVFAPLEVGNHNAAFECKIPNLIGSQQPPFIKVEGDSSCPIVHFELVPSDYLTSGRRDSSTLGPVDPNTKVIEMASCGIKIKSSKKFYLLNPTNDAYEFYWKSTTPDVTSVVCHTKKGYVQSGKKFECVFDFIPESIESVESFWSFCIPEHHVELPFIVVGVATEPKIFLSTSRINFQTVIAGSLAKRIIQLSNREQIPFSFHFEPTSFHASEDVAAPKIISISPTSGTIGPDKDIPVELSFKPIEEQKYNFNLACKVKRKSLPLYCNLKGEGYVINEVIELESLATKDPPILLDAKIINQVNFGSVQINDKSVRKIFISNNGSYSFDFTWIISQSKSLKVVPESGIVRKGEKLVCEIIFNPVNEQALNNLKLVCKITNGKSYTLLISGTGSQPRVDFNFLEYNFGPCFVYRQSMSPKEVSLIITNQDERDISFDSLYENTPQLEVGATATVLKKGESKKIPIVFKPRESKHYKEEVIFEVNGLYKTLVSITGEGTVPKVELINQSDKVLIFGSVKLGEILKKTVVLINRSKASVAIDFPKDLSSRFEKNFLSVNMKKQVVLAPKQQFEIAVSFTPQARLTSFTEELQLLVDGTAKNFSKISGACQGVECKLSSNLISFGAVVQNTHATQKLTLENTGDLGTKFKWSTKNLKPDFNITPLEGFIPVNGQIIFDVVFSPTKVHKESKVESLELKIENSPPILIAINGNCVEKPAQKEQLKFKQSVREKQTQQVKIENTSDFDWTLKPVIDNPVWSGDSILQIPAKKSATYDITYYPLRMTAKTSTIDIPSDIANVDYKPDEGSLFFPLPNGTAILYSLFGEASDPKPCGIITKELRAKEPLAEKLTLNNWLNTAQRFKVLFDFPTVASPNSITGSDTIDIPASSKRDYKFNFFAFKEGTFQGRIILINVKTREYLLYEVKLSVKAPSIVEIFTLETPIRQRISQSISIHNPVKEQVVLTAKCSNSNISIKNQYILSPLSESKIDFSFLPLLPYAKQEEADLVLENDILGIYSYKLKLNTITPGPEKTVYFKVALGTSQSQTIRFVNFCKTATDYTCKVSNPNFTVLTDKGIIKAGPVESLDGNELSLDLSFEPSEMGECNDKLTVSSAVGGEYTFLLVGQAVAPKPQGPIEVSASAPAKLAFKNVFNKKVDFKVTIDNPNFQVTNLKGPLSLAPKTKGDIQISYKPGTSSNYAKLVVSCPDCSPWQFYLSGKK